jgi:protein-S-isoprenylcysteine O-methyltransferase Ste14
LRSKIEIVGWLACVVYSTIPVFWLMIHPFAGRWRARRRSPYRLLIPLWVATWVVTALATCPWRHAASYDVWWTWILAAVLFSAGLFLYAKSFGGFSAAQLGGIPEVRAASRGQQLVTIGIRARVRHPIYLAHLCEMLAWSLGTGLIACWGLTALSLVSGAVMIRMEDAEMERRFGDEFRAYRESVPAFLPRVFHVRQL